jgi:NAD(P)-dependent dehydrogenase (short-subunit alcohol dehydrogenase family)
MDNRIIVLAGATGNLGGRIARAILEQGAGLRVIVRRSSDPQRVEELRQLGAEIAAVDFNSLSELTRVCSSGSCVVSALSGLGEVIMGSQTLLLESAVQADFGDVDT